MSKSYKARLMFKDGTFIGLVPPDTQIKSGITFIDVIDIDTYKRMEKAYTVTLNSYREAEAELKEALEKLEEYEDETGMG